MKRIAGLLIGILMAVTFLCIVLLPQKGVEAKEGETDTNGFTIKGGILAAYEGEERNITIPPNVTEIGPEAFKNSRLETVTIPGTVRKIDSRSFYGSENLYRVILQDGVKEIGSSAFSCCWKLDKVIIPASVDTIAPGAFSYCNALSELELSSDNVNFFYNDGVLYNRDSTELIQYLAGRKSSYYSMPFSVKKVDRYAFWGAELLRDVTISNNVKTIEPYTFANCTGLASIYLPESVTKIEANAFKGCSNLTYVGTESAVKTEEDAFKDCAKSLKVENGVEKQQQPNLPNPPSRTQIKVINTISGSSIPGTGTIPEINRTEPEGLMGASRIVGGNALVILSENQASRKSLRNGD